MIPLDFLLRQLLHHSENLVLSENLPVGIDVLVDRPIVGDDARHEIPDIALVDQDIRRLPVSMGVGRWHQDGVINTARRKRREGDLIPKSNIHDRERESDILDILVNLLLLITQQHHPTGGRDCCESARHETLDARILCGLRQALLLELGARGDGADEHVHAR